MALKRFKDINEGYDMDIDRGDRVEEHAKDVSGRYLDGSIGGMKGQGASNAMFDENMNPLPDMQVTERAAEVARAKLDVLNAEIEELAESGPDLQVVPPRVLKQQDFGDTSFTDVRVDEAGNALSITESAGELWDNLQQRLLNIESLRNCIRA